MSTAFNVWVCTIFSNISKLRSRNQASETHNLCRTSRCFVLFIFSRNFDDQLSSNLHRFVILCIYWDAPSEKTGLWRLPIVSSVFNTRIVFLILGKKSSCDHLSTKRIALTFFGNWFFPTNLMYYWILLRFVLRNCWVQLKMRLLAYVARKLYIIQSLCHVSIISAR